MSLLERDADVAVYAFLEFVDGDENAISTPLQHTEQVRELTNKNQIAKYALLGEHNFPDIHFMTVWGKLYKRKLIKQVDWEFSNYRAFEDNFWTPQAILAAKKVILMSDKLVFYRRNVQYGSFGSDVLSARLVGNSWNGDPVGCLELIDRIASYYKKLIKQQHIEDAEEALNEIIYVNKIRRLESLIRANLLGEENNLEYVKEIWEEHIKRDVMMQSEISRLNSEVLRLHGMKASARLLLGNIKRKVKKGI